MKDMTKKVTDRIDPERWYSLMDMVREGVFPWCSGIRTYRRTIHADRRAKDYLRANIIGEGRGRKYYVKGDNIIRFLRETERGSYRNRIQV